MPSDGIGSGSSPDGRTKLNQPDFKVGFLFANEGLERVGIDNLNVIFLV